VKQLLAGIIVGMVAASGWTQNSQKSVYSAEPYSRELVKLAEAGDARAQYSLGWAYFMGCKGPPIKTDGGLTMIKTILMKNTSVATDWFRKSAEQGYAEAQSILGECYFVGTGVEKNECEAFKWYKKAADQGLVEGEYFVGVFYEKGVGVSKDHKEAFIWLNKAAEQGDCRSMVELAELYLNGAGVTKDENEAIKWLTKASDQGFEPAKRKLQEIQPQPK
jgi:TPR repeat protein